MYMHGLILYLYMYKNKCTKAWYLHIATCKLQMLNPFLPPSSLSLPLPPSSQTVYPSPQWWTYHPSRNPTGRHQPPIVPVPASAIHPLSPPGPDHTGNIQESSNFQTKASKVRNIQCTAAEH